MPMAKLPPRKRSKTKSTHNEYHHALATYIQSRQNLRTHRFLYARLYTAWHLLQRGRLIEHSHRPTWIKYNLLAKKNRPKLSPLLKLPTRAVFKMSLAADSAHRVLKPAELAYRPFQASGI